MRCAGTGAIGMMVHDARRRPGRGHPSGGFTTLHPAAGLHPQQGGIPQSPQALTNRLRSLNAPQVVVIPIPNSKLGEEAVQAMLDRADAIAADLKAAGVVCCL